MPLHDFACVDIDVTNGIQTVVAVGTKYNCTCIKCETCVQGLRSGLELRIEGTKYVARSMQSW
jgi:hypothetical protein